MDPLEAWAIQGRVATAIKNVGESIARLAKDGEELVEAMAEAEHFGVYSEPPATATSSALSQPAKGLAG